MDTPDKLCSAALSQRQGAVAEALVEREFAAHPDLTERYGALARHKSLQDANYHLDCLIQATAAGNATLFADYIAWVKVVLARRGVSGIDLAFHLDCLDEALAAELPDNAQAPARKILAHTRRLLPDFPDDLPCLIDAGQPHAALAHQYLNALLRGDRQHASRLILDAADRGTDIRAIYLDVFQRAQREIGRLWQTNHISVAQEHYCTAATQLIMSQLYPRIFSGNKNGLTFVGTCVAGNLHEIGVRMVADFFEMEGWDTHYLGANTPPEGVVQHLAERQADILGISATLTSQLDQVEALIRRVRGSPDGSRVRILVGGYPFNLDPELWKKLGADGHGSDAADAVALATRLRSNKAPI